MKEVEHVQKMLMESVDEFLRVLMLKMDPTVFTSFAYPYDKSDYADDDREIYYIELRVKRMLSQELLNNTKNGLPTIFKLDESSSNNVEIRAPPGFVDNLYSVNEVNDLRIKLVKYVANPFVYNTNISKFIDSPVIVFEIMDELTNKINIDISSSIDQIGYIQITIPYSEMKHYDR